MESKLWHNQEVSIIGQGTWESEIDGDQAVRGLQLGLDLGMTHIDTAEMYGGGLAEQVVGRAIQGRRDEVFLVSKVLPSNASYQGTIEACERSLRHLNVETLDCYLLHWRGNSQLAEAVRGFQELKRQGKIKSFGVSNFDVEDLNDLLKLVGAEEVACNQVFYHLKERAVEPKLLPFCLEKGIALVAYSPFGQGDFPESAELENLVDGKTARQVALRFLIQKGAFVIPKASKEPHVRDNAGADGWSLTEDQMATIDRLFPVVPKDFLPTI